MKWGEEDDGRSCARTLPDNVSGSEQEDAVTQRQRSGMRLKLYIVITTKVKENFKVGVSCQRVTCAGVISLQRRNNRKLRRKQWRIKLKMK